MENPLGSQSTQTEIKIKSYIDAHCHLADPRYTPTHLRELMIRSINQGICGWVQGGISPSDWDRQLVLQKEWGSGVIPCFGAHPWWVSQTTEKELEHALQTLEVRLFQAKGIGELGLDFQEKFNQPGIFERQEHAFSRQLRLALKSNKPLVLHIVRAHTDAIKILQKFAPFRAGGIVHSFSAAPEIAQEYIKMGFLISIGGVITRKGYKNLKNAVRSIPLDKIVVETDSPDQIPLLPASTEGIQPPLLNEPTNLFGIAEVLAQYMSISSSELLDWSTRNLKQLFDVSL